jgi:hypothetical protein
VSARDRLLQRIGQAILRADLGVAGAMLKRKPLRTINQALTASGHRRLPDLKNLTGLRRAALVLEAEADG